MDNKIKLGILGGGEDSLIGVLHRVASSMHDKYELIGGVFNPKHSISLDFGKNLDLIPIEFIQILIPLLRVKVN